MTARRLISLSIVVGLAASFLAASPAAAATVTVNNWAGLQAAMLIDGDTVVLGSDITAPADERAQVESGESVTLDLAGRALVIASPLEDQSALRVVETASLTIIDSIGGGSLSATSGRNAAGIGGDEFDSAGTITINGGTVTSSGGINGAGIGGGSAFAGNVGDGGGGMVTINGGTVIANGGRFNAAGVGGGACGNGGTITINGGTVTATAGWNAAGLGGGDALCGGGDGGVITINGGTVIANGGALNGPGIGGGTQGGDGGTIAINGGSVTALGGSGGAGIGTGARGGDGGIITITAGTIVATGGTAAAGIGGGRNGGSGATLTISGGVVTATGGSNESVGGGAGIGTGASLVADAPAVGIAQLSGTLTAPFPTSGSAAAGTDVTYVPGSDLILGITASAGRFVTVTTTNGAPPDSGAGGAVVIEYAFDVTLDSANGSSPASVRVDAETPVSEPATPTREGFEFAGWRLGSAAGDVYDFTAPVTGPITIVAVWQPILADTGADAEPWLGAALALFVGGILLVIAAQRRRLT